MLPGWFCRAVGAAVVVPLIGAPATLGIVGATLLQHLAVLAPHKRVAVAAPLPGVSFATWVGHTNAVLTTLRRAATAAVAAATVAATLLAFTGRCTTFSLVANLEIHAAAVHRAGLASLAYRSITLTVAAVIHHATAAAVLLAFVDANAVPGRVAAIGVLLADARLARAPAATGRVGGGATVIFTTLSVLAVSSVRALSATAPAAVAAALLDHAVFTGA